MDRATYRDKSTGLISAYPRRVAEKFSSLEEIDPETHECVGCKKSRRRSEPASVKAEAEGDSND